MLFSAKSQKNFQDEQKHQKAYANRSARKGGKEYHFPLSMIFAIRPNPPN
jgi:hypothetical protein